MKAGKGRVKKGNKVHNKGEKQGRGDREERMKSRGRDSQRMERKELRSVEKREPPKGRKEGRRKWRE